MSKSKKTLFAIFIIGAVLAAIDGFAMYKTSIRTHEVTVDTPCFSFLGGNCKYVSENRLVTDFKPFTLTNLIVIPASIIIFLFVLLLFSVGEGGLNALSRLSLLVVGLIVFALSIGAVSLYGSRHKGHYIVTGGLTPQCESARNFDLNQMIQNGPTQDEQDCWNQNSNLLGQ